jgi:predicted phosphoribosyltransferase
MGAPGNSEPNRIFRDRSEAGRELGARLAERNIRGSIVVLGLPRGGVPVACEVADRLNAPVDVLIVRKLGAPFQPELAVGSVASGGVTVLNQWILDQLGLDTEALSPIIERERAELIRRERAYRGNNPPPELADKVVVLVDDGAATGATMHAGVEAVKALGPERVIVALPTSSADAVDRLKPIADEVIVISTPEPYYAVGYWYRTFDQLTDNDVADWLARASRSGGD